MGWWLGCLVQRSDRSSRRHNHIEVLPCLTFSHEFQSTCLALRLLAIRTGNPQLNQAVDLLRSVGRKTRDKPNIQPSQAKVLNGGRDLHKAQVNVPLSVSHTCV